MKKIDLIYAESNWFEDYVRFMNRRKNAKKQRTYCWCPICNEDLCSNGSFRSDTDLVRYECENCHCRSSWNFDAPVPILINHDKIIYDKTI